MRPREGVLVSSDPHGLVFRRIFFTGPLRWAERTDPGRRLRPDGNPGRAWSIKHSYFTRKPLLIGHYYNINTPVELYPHGARYLDLEVDIIQRAGKTNPIDREKLVLLCRNGCISQELGTKAPGCRGRPSTNPELERVHEVLITMEAGAEGNEGVHRPKGSILECQQSGDFPGIEIVIPDAVSFLH